MRNKRIALWAIALIIPLTFGIIFSGCKKDDTEDCPTVDYTTLDAAITEAQALHDGAVEGTNPGEYLAGSKATLQAAINTATEVRNLNCVTQQQLDAAEVALDAAVVAFEDAMITDVNPDALVAHWLFNGDATDASGNAHDGTVSAGHVNWGAGMPALDTDRHGNANYCYKFMDGGNIVVPQSPAFNPVKLSISVWMKLYETWAHSYFISNDIWHCWKFQVQDANKPFFTAHFNKNDGSGEGWIDHDSGDATLDLDMWYHVVVTYEGGKMTFYIDGEMVQEWADFDPGVNIDPHAGIDLCIGQALPTIAFEDPDHQWSDGMGFFKGYLDDMRFYNDILTSAQVKSLYDYEKATTIE